MKFYTDESINTNKNNIVLNPDNSFGSACDDKDSWHFQVSFTEWADVILNFNKYTYKCISCEGFVSKASKRMVFKNLDILKFTEAALLFKSDVSPEYGVELALDNQAIYFDEEKSIIAFGDNESQETLIKFGEGQFVKLRDTKIVAIYIALK
jgi:hypothetical protein